MLIPRKQQLSYRLDFIRLKMRLCRNKDLGFLSPLLFVIFAAFVAAFALLVLGRGISCAARCDSTGPRHSRDDMERAAARQRHFYLLLHFR